MKKITISIWCFFCLLITGCSYVNSLIDGPPGSPCTLPKLKNAMTGYYVSSMCYDSKALVKAGGKVYKVGDFVGIYIPTDKLFEPNTADFLPQANLILNNAAVVLSHFPMNDILISGSTSGFYKVRWERWLSEARAQKVAAFLWYAGFNQVPDPDMTKTKHRLTYVGYGDYFPVANHITNTGIRQNSRIQITSSPQAANLRPKRAKPALTECNYAQLD